MRKQVFTGRNTQQIPKKSVTSEYIKEWYKGSVYLYDTNDDWGLTVLFGCQKEEIWWLSLILDQKHLTKDKPSLNEER